LERKKKLNDESSIQRPFIVFSDYRDEPSISEGSYIQVELSGGTVGLELPCLVFPSELVGKGREGLEELQDDVEGVDLLLVTVIGMGITIPGM
jgi:hypothetical protein